MSDLLKWQKGGLKTPLSRARGLGSAKSGLQDWITVRITSVANIFLMSWFSLSMIHLIGTGHDGFIAWLSQPLNAIFMCAFVISSFVHAKLGLQVIIEDYVHNEGNKIRELLALNLLFWFGVIVSVFSILKIAFGAY